MSWRIRLAHKAKPAGWELIEPSLDFFENKMKDAVNDSGHAKRRAELSWPIHRIHYEKNRYIFDLYYNEKKISKELYEFLGRHKIIDTALCSKWRQPGYEFLCSMMAINKSATNFGTTSICRVPLAQRSGHVAPSNITGCVSCASGDSINGGPIWWTDPYTTWAPKSKKRGRGKGAHAGGEDLQEPALDPEIEARLKALRGDPATAAAPAVDGGGAPAEESAPASR